MNDEVRLTAWAKLTLSLRVTGVRDDGYHLLDSEMVSVDLGDTVEILSGEGLTVVDEVVGGLGVAGVPSGGDNLVTRAMALIGRRGHLRLTKRIPAGSGLGGGSSDAAAVLRWAGRGDPATAARLGADVAFCVRGGRARVTGIGEVLEPLEHEDREFLLLVPPLSVSTAEVYRAWDARRSPGSVVRDASDEGGEGGEGNDLEPAAMEVEPKLAAWRDVFADATGIKPRLAGSGSTWFVEAGPGELEVAERGALELGGERGALVVVRSVPPTGTM